ncbi:MAG: prenyltransferase/squalene oxidase repeat-containing protein [Phycisphaerales bacterium]
MIIATAIVTLWIAADVGGTAAPAVPAPVADAAPAPAPFGPASPPTGAEVDAMVREGLAFLVSAQEGEPRAQWPYEGVYRVRGEIPFGYRIGGTSIVGECLVRMPGYASDAARREAVARACRFVCAGTAEPLMDPVYDAGYDVRGWGYCYGARFLLVLRAAKAVPAGQEAEVDRALGWYLDAMQRTEIPEVGGWNYARQPGIETPCPMSPFMTAPCLQVLFEARAQGLKVDAAVVSRALDALERCRTGDGNFAYSAQRQTREPARTMPGAIGRMVCGESVLMRAGRSDAARVRASVDAFLEHWIELEKRRRKNGTHVAPYGVAPYYFFFGFFHASDAVEMLPEAERGEYRRQLVQLLAAVRDADGTWDDRVFPRSRSFGTAMAIMALVRPDLPAPAAWATPSEP